MEDSYIKLTYEKNEASCAFKIKQCQTEGNKGINYQFGLKEGII